MTAVSVGSVGFPDRDHRPPPHHLLGRDATDQVQRSGKTHELPAGIILIAAMLGVADETEQGVKAEVVRADALTFEPSAPFDAIYEQTCLCAIHPDHWQTYAAQLHRWLKPGGQLWVLFMQMLRPSAAQEGVVQGPPYHCDINAMRALLPASQWDWPKPPYVKVPHPSLQHELALTLTRY